MIGEREVFPVWKRQPEAMRWEKGTLSIRCIQKDLRVENTFQYLKPKSLIYWLLSKGRNAGQARSHWMMQTVGLIWGSGVCGLCCFQRWEWIDLSFRGGFTGVSPPLIG